LPDIEEIAEGIRFRRRTLDVYDVSIQVVDVQPVEAGGGLFAARHGRRDSDVRGHIELFPIVEEFQILVNAVCDLLSPLTSNALDNCSCGRRGERGRTGRSSKLGERDSRS